MNDPRGKTYLDNIRRLSTFISSLLYANENQFRFVVAHSFVASDYSNFLNVL